MKTFAKIIAFVAVASLPFAAFADDAAKKDAPPAADKGGAMKKDKKDPKAAKDKAPADKPAADKPAADKPAK